MFTDGRLAEWDVINHIIGWGDTMATVTNSNEIYAQIDSPFLWPHTVCYLPACKVRFWPGG